jgi:hypothetical protein
MQRKAVWGVAFALLLAAGEALAQASPFSDGADARADPPQVPNMGLSRGWDW